MPDLPNESLKDEAQQIAFGAAVGGALSFASIMGCAGIAGAAAAAAAKAGATIGKENRRDLTVPNDLQNGVISATEEHLRKRPVEATVTGALLGPAAVVEQAVAHKALEHPAVQGAAAAVGAKAQAEAVDTAVKLSANPLNPQGVLAQKGVELAVEAAKANAALQARAVGEAINDVRNIPAKAAEFEKDRPVTSAIIDGGIAGASGVLVIPGIDKVIGTGIKGAAQTASDKVDNALKFLGIR
jgi:hypothetical protein